MDLLKNLLVELMLKYRLSIPQEGKIDLFDLFYRLHELGILTDIQWQHIEGVMKAGGC